jgi:hypothetical protein
MLAPLVGLLVALAAAAPAEPPRPSATAPVPAPDALALAKVMSPRELRVEGELRQFDLNFRKTLMQSEDVRALEAKYPGTIDAMAKAARPFLAEETGRIADSAYPKMAQILAGELTGSEIAKLEAYYGSPAGQNLLRLMVQSVDASALYAEALKGDGKVSEETASTETFIAALKAGGQISDSDRAALKGLMGDPVWPKLHAVQPKLLKVLLDAVNTPDPAYEKQVEEAMAAAAEAHIKSVDSQAKSKAK